MTNCWQHVCKCGIEWLGSWYKTTGYEGRYPQIGLVGLEMRTVEKENLVDHGLRNLERLNNRRTLPRYPTIHSMQCVIITWLTDVTSPRISDVLNWQGVHE